MSKQTAIVVCPGRGTYNADELGYLSRYHADKSALIQTVDNVQIAADKEAVSALDGAAKFSPSKHGRGDNASALIYACAMADFQSINKEIYDVVGVTGNSMGWYLSLAAGGAINLEDGAKLVGGMGGIMTEQGVGGQVVYPIVDEDWNLDEGKQKAVQEALQSAPDLKISTSIHLGGLQVFAASDAGVKHLLQTLPKNGIFPFQLRGHSAFHSSQLSHCVAAAQSTFSPAMFSAPKVPLIDGVGNLWRPHAEDTQALYDYTLGRQIDGTYDFTRAVTVAAKEFAPDVFIILGPGTTMGAPVAQSLIFEGWDGLSGKTDFQLRQEKQPLIISMGRDDQRHLATG
ncbi:MAG: ACP S-malonyltransferase [Maricaulaceae bacterium]